MIVIQNSTLKSGCTLIKYNLKFPVSQSSKIQRLINEESRELVPHEDHVAALARRKWMLSENIIVCCMLGSLSPSEARVISIQFRVFLCVTVSAAHVWLCVTLSLTQLISKNSPSFTSSYKDIIYY